MTSNSTKLPVLGSDGEIAVGLLDEWFDPIEAGLRDRVRDFIQTMIESELEAVLSRPRYARRPNADPENIRKRHANWIIPRRTRALPALASPFSRRRAPLSSGEPVRPG